MLRKKLIASTATLLLVVVPVCIYLTYDTEDARLVNAVKRAAALRLQPDVVEKYVGRPATINTLRKGDADVLAFALGFSDFGEDKRPLSLSTIFGRSAATPGPGARMNAAQHVVYWVRTRNGRYGNSRIVVITWQADGTAEMFHAVVLPP